MVNQVNVTDTNGQKRKDYEDKVSEIEGKVPTITGLATIAALSALAHKMPNTSDIARNAKCDAKISENEKKYFTASDCNNSTNDILDTKLKKNEYRIFSNKRPLSFKRPSPTNAQYDPKNIL